MTRESTDPARRDDGSGTPPLRIGVLGAARISGQAIVDPAHATGDRLVAVAARDPERAKQFAAEQSSGRSRPMRM
jgi:predicted dehydrogenase